MNNNRKYTLRQYQNEAIENIFNELRSSDKALVTLPTGSGKAVILAEIANLCYEKNRKILILVNKNILIKQLQNTCSYEVSIYNAGLNKKELDGKIIIASVQSFCKLKEFPYIDCIIIDECHRTSSMHEIILTKYPNCKLIGFTATPFNQHGLIFGDDKLWPKPCYIKTLSEMLELGYLVPVKYREGSNSVNPSELEVSRMTGDYKEDELAALFNQVTIEEQVKDALDRSKFRNKVIFLTTCIDHAQKVYDQIPHWNKSIIHSKQTKEDFNFNLDSFKNSGKYLVSVLIASEGFDYPASDCLVLMRPTRSIVLYIQAVGRVLRIAPDKKDALVLDYGKVIESLGDVFDITLDMIRDKKVRALIKQCPECFEWIKETKGFCECGYEFLKVCNKHFIEYKFSESCKKCDETQKEIDRLKSLTNKAFEPEDLIQQFNVTNIQFEDEYISKAGKKCMRVIFNTNEMLLPIYKFYFSWTKKEYEYLKNNSSLIRKILCKKSGKYYSIEDVLLEV